MKLTLRNRLTWSLAAACALALASFSHGAETKIGLVDMKKVFDGYYKTKQADGQLKERAGDAEKVLRGMIEDLQKSSEEYKKLVDGVNDAAVSADERDRRKKNAESKLMELQEVERSVKKYRADTQGALDDQKRRMRESILREIRDIINTKAKAAGYTHVIDTAAESLNMTPFLLYTTGENDMSEAILKEINANAPAIPASAAAEPEKPAVPTNITNPSGDLLKKKN